MIDTEDRKSWYKMAETWEVEFCELLSAEYGYKVVIHPKKKKGPASIDLLFTLGNGSVMDAELKPMFTPFLKAYNLFRVPSQYCLTFNVSDYWHYSRTGCQWALIFFWFKFDFVSNPWGVDVQQMNQIWYTQIGDLLEFIDKTEPPIHEYGRRVGRSDNATSSYVMDVRKFRLLEKKGKDYAEKS